MKSTLTLLVIIFYVFAISGCDSKKDYVSPSILEDRAFSIEKMLCDDKNKYFNWRCSFNENYLQKDITTPHENTFLFQFNSDNFNRTNYGFRVLIFINNIIKFRRTTRDFPLETTLFIPKGAVIVVKTYVERYPNVNNENPLSGNVNCKVSCQ